MKIIAKIPARAGSKGIPNKNIRIICGHPLVYYAIDNAKKSKYIDDVIVTTDSPEIEIIAKQMGVGVHKRNPDLARDQVTLDSVVYDVIKGINDIDYVITMQPTSPTLRTKTLDDAIEYAIKEQTDTLISVINKPHLAWGRKKRSNRAFI